MTCDRDGSGEAGETRHAVRPEGQQPGREADRPKGPVMTPPQSPEAIELARLLDDYQRARSDKRIFDAVGIRSSVFELVAKNRACIIAGLDLLATQENEVFGLEGDE